MTGLNGRRDMVSGSVTFLFKAGRRERIERARAGPSEFFYGYVELNDRGVPVNLVDERVFGFDDSPPRVWTALSRLSVALCGIHAWAVHRLARRIDRLATAQVIVTLNNTYGVALACLKTFGRVRPAVIFVAMGLLDESPRERIVRSYLLILRNVTLAVVSRPERDHLAAKLPGIDVHYLPFGVDHNFWQPSPSAREGNYVLSVGNDPHRDYATLIESWRPDFPLLKIVTRRPVPKERPENIEIIAGDWRTEQLSDTELRDLIHGSLFVVVPVRDTLQPSGQSACLQAMACGKAVIMSDIKGLWDRDLMRNNDNCILVPPGNANLLRQAAHGLTVDGARAFSIGRAARHTIEDHLNAEMMAAALRELCIAAGADIR